jgi:diguanylate cyclase
MLYKDTAPRSAEILRLALPNISRHGGSFAPTNYAVWYEHLAGTNAGLSDDINQRLQQSESLDDEVISELYADHILSRDVQSSRLLQRNLETLARQIDQAAATSSNNTEQYARGLETTQIELQSLTDPQTLDSILQKLISLTRHAHESVGALRAELNARQQELRTVRDRLGTLETEVLKDPLTGLLNRRGFDKALEQLEADGFALTSACVLMLDLDHFKHINDNYGHLFGDQVLSAAAKLLSGTIKGRDVAARFGGEEFVVLLPETPESGGMALAEQFRDAISRAKIRRTGSDKVIDKLTVSIGVAAPRTGESLDSTMERADAALYRAKNEGRNCVRVALPD